MGNITDILLATVVTDKPAFLVEWATRKNIRINKIPIMMLMGSHRESSMEAGAESPVLMIKPRNVATR